MAARKLDFLLQLPAILESHDKAVRNATRVARIGRGIAVQFHAIRQLDQLGVRQMGIVEAVEPNIAIG